MKGVLLSAITASDRIKSFHYCMFHGETHDPDHSLRPNSTPLRISRNGRIVPEIFGGGSFSLIFSERARLRLDSLQSPNVRFADVSFSKLIDFHYQAGDLSYYRTSAFVNNPQREAPESLLERMPDVPRLHQTIGRYYELAVPRHEEVISDAKQLPTVAFKVRYLGDDYNLQMPLAPHVLSEYPVLESGLGPKFCYLASDVAFNAISQFLDLDYYEVSISELY